MPDYNFNQTTAPYIVPTDNSQSSPANTNPANTSQKSTKGKNTGEILGFIGQLVGAVPATIDSIKGNKAPTNIYEAPQTQAPSEGSSKENQSSSMNTPLLIGGGIALLLFILLAIAIYMKSSSK